MIRKEEVDVRELNRKLHAHAQLKPSLDAFPVKEFAVPFNSLRNRHGILNAELEIPESFRDETLGVAEQINEIRNGNKNNVVASEPTENLQLNIVEDNLEENQVSLDEQPLVEQQPLVEHVVEQQPMEVSGPVESIEVNKFLDDIEEEISEPPSVEDKPQIDNKFLRAIMDIKRNTVISKTLIVLFLIIMAVLIYFGIHKKI